MLQAHGLHPADEEINGLGVEIAAKSLKLRGKEDEIGVIDLLGCIASTATVASDGAVSISNFVERTGAVDVPSNQRFGRHLDQIERYQLG